MTSSSTEQAIEYVLDFIREAFEEMQDGDDTPFGPFARVEEQDGGLLIGPDPNPNNWEDGKVPDLPLVKITVTGR